MYRELPAPAGAPGLACLWVHRVDPGALPTRILPDACSDLIWIEHVGVHLAGPDTTAAMADIPVGTLLIGARFGPGAGGPALGRSLEELRDQRLPLPGLVDPDAAPEDALRLLADRVTAMLAAAPPDDAVREAARRLAADPRRRTAALAADLGLSERQLRRRCLAAAGHAPKPLQRVLRLQRVVRAMDTGDHDLARLAADHGYADQAHLTGDFSQLAGLPPAALLRSRASAAGSAAG